MNKKAKKVLFIDLEKKNFEVKSFSDLSKYIGGVSLAIKLYKMFSEQNPVVFSVGPLCGFFPFASKTCIVTGNSGNVEDMYIGGSLSLRIKYSGIDAIVLLGKAKTKTALDIRDLNVHFISEDHLDYKSMGIPAKRSVMEVTKSEVLLDNHFSTTDNFLRDRLVEKNILGLVISGTENYYPPDFKKYVELYKKILAKKDEITVKSDNNPSCSLCPMGCAKAKKGELGGNVLVHSVGGCEFSESIYSDIGIVFSCLDVLGYDYTHEDIENLPKLIEEALK